MARILVVDDDKDIIEVIKYVAAQNGHVVLEASNGREGLERATTQQPDLIILDIMMPEMDGFTLNNRLLTEQTTQKIPVIILTAKGRMREAFLAATNVRAYMDKPFEPTALLEQIQTVLAEKARR
jgi:two-component system, OmpR family, alkaline phosphatase synthesis response regulator PhoP